MVHTAQVRRDDAPTVIGQALRRRHLRFRASGKPCSNRAIGRSRSRTSDDDQHNARKVPAAPSTSMTSGSVVTPSPSPQPDLAPLLPGRPSRLQQ